MAAVAGAVADEILTAIGDGVPKAYVNNGGDIAVQLAAGESLRIGVVADPDRASRHGHRLPLDGAFAIDAAIPVRGVATSGWRGRSRSLGIADSVTVLAASGACADAAATMIANAVDIDHAAVVATPRMRPRRRQRSRRAPRDDGCRSATRRRRRRRARRRRCAAPDQLADAGLIWGAVLALQRRYRVVGGVAGALPPR